MIFKKLSCLLPWFHCGTVRPLLVARLPRALLVSLGLSNMSRPVGGTVAFVRRQTISTL